MKNRVAILLPAYNAEATIARAIRSIQAQSYDNWRVYVINDGSTDGTRSALLAFDDERILVVDLNPNVGLSGALNRGLEEIQERFVFRMDADDQMDPRRLEIQLAHAQRCPGAGVYCAAIRINGKRVQKPRFKNTEDLRELLCFSNPIAHPTVMFDRDHLPAELAYHAVTCEDYELWCRLAGLGIQFERTTDPVLNYFVSDAQKSIIEKNDAMKQAKEIADNYTQLNFPHIQTELKTVGYFFDLNYRFSTYVKFAYKTVCGNIFRTNSVKKELLHQVIKKVVRSAISR